MAEQAKEKGRNLESDLSLLIDIFLTRRTNLESITTPMAGSDEWKNEFVAMKNAYNITKDANKAWSSFPTLLRISQAVPPMMFVLAHRLESVLNFVVSETDIGGEILLDAKMNYVSSMVDINSGNSKVNALFILNNTR